MNNMSPKARGAALAQEKETLRAKVSVKNLLIFAISVLIVPTIIIYSIFSLMQIVKSSDAALAQTLPTAASMAARSVSNKLEQYTMLAEDAASESVLFDEEATDAKVNSVLAQKAKKYGMLGIYVYDRSGKGLNTSASCADKAFYDKALQGNTVIEEPVSDSRFGELAISVSAPIWQGGVSGSNVVGVIECVVPQSVINNLIDEINISKNNVASIVDSSGTAIAFRDVQKVIEGENTVKLAQTNSDYKGVAALITKAIGGETGTGSYKLAGQSKIAAFAPIEGSDGWSVFVSAPESDFNAQVKKSYISIAILAVVFVLYAIFGLSISIPKITKPLAILVGVLGEIARGNFEVEIPPLGDTYKDLIALRDSVRTLKGSTTEVIGDIGYVLGAMAEGNFTVESRVPEMYIGDYSKIREAQVVIKDSLSTTLSEILEVSEQVSAGSEQVSNGAQSLAQGATEQASSVEQLSASVGEVARQIAESAKQAENASNLTNDAGSIMQGSVIAMTEAKSAMREISDTSRNISKVIKAIDDIAFQTNILALNAAVEAARAGSAGKGFAVVADEVRNLSQKSAEAAKNTTALIESSIMAVEKGDKLVGTASEDFEQVAVKAAEVTEIVGNLSLQFQEQAVAANQISLGIGQVASVVQMNSATSEESAAASEELSSQANVLRSLVSRFKLGND